MQQGHIHGANNTNIQHVMPDNTSCTCMVVDIGIESKAQPISDQDLYMNSSH